MFFGDIRLKKWTIKFIRKWWNVKVYSGRLQESMCDKTVDTYPSAIQIFPECYKTHKIFDRVVDTCPFVFDFVPNWYKNQEMCDKFVSEEPVTLKYSPRRYKT